MVEKLGATKEQEKKTGPKPKALKGVRVLEMGRPSEPRIAEL